MVQSGTNRYSCVITTVDPTSTTSLGAPAPIIEGVIKSGKTVQISLYNIPTAFRWPVVGETWMIVQYNGSWYLDGIFPLQNSYPSSYVDYDQGDLILDSYSGRVVVLSKNGSFILDSTEVTSFNGRTGAVTPQSGDYVASQITGTWTAYTPTVTSTAGSITSYAVNGYYLKLSSGLLVMSADVSLTNVGTAGGDLVVPLPAGYTSRYFASAIARENAVTGKIAFANLQGSSNTVHMYGSSLDGASSWTNGYEWAFTIAIPI